MAEAAEKDLSALGALSGLSVANLSPMIRIDRKGAIPQSVKGDGG